MAPERDTGRTTNRRPVAGGAGPRLRIGRHRWSASTSGGSSPGPAYVDVAGRRAEGVPVFDASFTPPEGVVGRLGPVGSGSAIGVAMAGPHSKPEYREARRSGGHEAIVAVTPEGPGVALVNANSFADPFGPSGAPGGQRGPGVADGGGGPRLPSAGGGVVFPVSVPLPQRDGPAAGPRRWPGSRGRHDSRSGWWHCAGERGGGIACWLEVMRSMAAEPPARDLLFVATSGHEIGLPGLDALPAAEGRHTDRGRRRGSTLGRTSAPPRASGPTTRPRDEGLQLAAGTALRESGAETAMLSEAMVGAESNVITARGARCAAMVGGDYALFHRVGRSLALGDRRGRRSVLRRRLHQAGAGDRLLVRRAQSGRYIEMDVKIVDTHCHARHKLVRAGGDAPETR